MQQYKDLLTRVLTKGKKQRNRTGIDAVRKAGDSMYFDLAEGFPLNTIRQAAWKSSCGEMIAFANGYTNAEQFRALKCHFWDKNANKDGVDLQGNIVPNKWLTNPNRKGEDDLGEVYGYQWRYYEGKDGVVIDQFKAAIHEIMTNPSNRRIIVDSWRPDRFNHMALPPCHVLFQFLADEDDKELSLNMYIRSNDLFLGAPANIVEYAFLLEIVAMATGYKARHFNYFIGDAHIYENHLEQVNTILQREPYPLPKLEYQYDVPFCPDAEQAVNWICSLHPDDFKLVGYQHHDPITGDMAV